MRKETKGMHGMAEKKEGAHNHRREHAGTQGNAPPAEQSPKNGTEETAHAQSAAEVPETGNVPEAADALKKKLEAQSDSYLRLMAEFDNFKKRATRDYERLVESANERLMVELIDIRENLERAVRAGEQCDDGRKIHEGLKIISATFNEICARNGLEPFGAPGESFDPQFHDAIMKTPDETVPEDHIIEVFEKGYLLKKRVVKHAKVVVSSGTPSVPEGADAEEDEKGSAQQG
jgi:molecular chaperone GrpE